MMAGTKKNEFPIIDMRDVDENREKPTGKDTHATGGRQIARFLGEFLYPPVKRTDIVGYGQSLTQRHPDITRKEIRELAARDIGPATLMAVALLTGIVAGVAASLLKLGISFLSRSLTGLFRADGLNWWLILMPAAGLILVGIFQRYIIHRLISHGDDRLRHDFATNRCYLPLSLTYNPIIACTVTLGFGGSAGSEGPIAYSGAAIGSNIGALFRISPGKVRMLTAIGAGAGIAGIFKAPIGGVLFTIEVLGIELTTVAVAALVVSCVAASLTAYLLSGCTPDIPFHHAAQISLDNFPLILLFGIVCGLYSSYYAGSMGILSRYLGKLRNPWVKNIIAGLSIGLMTFCFPPLYGEGYGVVAHLLDGNWSDLASGGLFHGIGNHSMLLLAVAFGTIAAKSFATAATNDGGGVAGDFAPTIMAGSVVGFFYAYLLESLCGITLPVSDYVFMGMAGILAGAVRAPLMAMFLVTEMATMGYGQFMPVAIVATLSYLTVCLVKFIGRKRSPDSRHGGYKAPRREDPRG